MFFFSNKKKEDIIYYNTSLSKSSTRINGQLIHGETELHHGDRIALGLNHYFRINCPTDTNLSLSGANNVSLLKHVNSVTDFSRAQEEVLLQNKGTHSNNNHANQSSNDSDNSSVTNSVEDESKSLSSTFSNSNSIDENGVALEIAIQRLENDYSNTKNAHKNANSSENSSNSPSSVSTSSISIGKCRLIKLYIDYSVNKSTDFRLL